MKGYMVALCELVEVLWKIVTLVVLDLVLQYCLLCVFKIVVIMRIIYDDTVYVVVLKCELCVINVNSPFCFVVM